MNSIDTNILLYALNQDAPEHVPALGVVRTALAEPTEWTIADQVYLELYRLLRNPAVLQMPLDASGALERINYFRRSSGILRCAYDIETWALVEPVLGITDFSARRTFDLVLAATLRRSGVTKLYTHNPSDFQQLDWFEVVDPIESIE